MNSDGNIRYYEYEHDKFEYLSEHKSADPQRGIAFVPKRGINTHENEVMRAYRTVNDAFIEPVSFIVPRRAEVFQGDIYPPTVGSTPAMSSADYFGGKTASLPPKISLESLYDGTEPEEIPAEKTVKPAAVKETPAPAATPAAAPAPTPATPSESQGLKFTSVSSSAPTLSRSSLAGMNDNKASMSSMADKFADRDADDSDGTSSFEEVPKPIERPSAAVATRQEEKTGVVTPPVSHTSPTKTTSAAPLAPADEPSTFSGETIATSTPTPETTKAPHSTNGATAPANDERPSTSAAKGAADGIRGVLQDIKGMLAQQGQVMATQGEKIEILAREVANLKARLGE